LLRTRSVSQTARSLGISQPAVSQALHRLRAAFGDALLVPLGRELQLTERATGLAVPLQGALAELDTLLRPQRPFEPANEELHVVISTADYVALLLAPILAEIAAIEAPGVVFEFVAGAVHHADDLALVDFMIGPRPFGQTLGKRIGVMPLWHDDVVCIVGASNRTIPARITPEAFRQLRHAAFQRNPAVSERLRMLMQPTSALETRRVCTLPDSLYSERWSRKPTASRWSRARSRTNCCTGALCALSSLLMPTGIWRSMRIGVLPPMAGEATLGAGRYWRVRRAVSSSQRRERTDEGQP
jgi:DNA-binding transcriptional LysR family regulator